MEITLGDGKEPNAESFRKEKKDREINLDRNTRFAEGDVGFLHVANRKGRGKPVRGNNKKREIASMFAGKRRGRIGRRSGRTFNGGMHLKKTVLYKSISYDHQKKLDW